MIALEHLQTNALLMVLFWAAVALLSLRAAVYFSERARTQRDLAILSAANGGLATFAAAPGGSSHTGSTRHRTHAPADSTRTSSRARPDSLP